MISYKTYARYVALTLVVVLIFMVGVYSVVKLAKVLLVLFGSILFAILIDSLTRAARKAVPLNRTAMLIMTVLSIVSVVGGTIWLMGPGIVAQLSELTVKIPEALGAVQAWLAERPWGEGLAQQIATLETAGEDSVERVTQALASVATSITYTVLIVIIGFYLALHPHRYVDGFMHLIPRTSRVAIKTVLDALRRSLGWWLIGRGASMLVVGTLITLGLWIIGMPLALSLGFIATLLCFVPYIGPVLASVPALLLALVEGPQMLALVGIVYWVVQFLETNFITPLIEDRAVSLPPALTIATQLIMGTLVGLAGLLVATPLLLCLIVIIQVLYIRGALGVDVPVLGSKGEETKQDEAKAAQESAAIEAESAM
ncbi:MAG: AI-2E family transporter [Rhodothermales bacterium]